MTVIGSDTRRMVIGLGKSGLSCARYLRRRGLPFEMADTRDAPASADAFRREFPEIALHTGALDSALLKRFNEIILSPGIDPGQPVFEDARQAGCALLGDIELFWREAAAPIVAITGTNAKSTVTTLVWKMAEAAGLAVRCGGNLGPPALDLLDSAASLYVLELSSFQLETVDAFTAHVAAILNMAPDHLDRYDGMAPYHRAKQRIYRGAHTVVYNREDGLTSPLLAGSATRISFGLNSPDLGQYGILQSAGEDVLACGVTRLMNTSELALKGRHNVANALAAMAIASAAGIDRTAQKQVLSTWAGLPHRCQFVATIDQVDFINDSKATNVAASVAGLQGFAGHGRSVLIAGGIAKETDFTTLRDAVARYARAVVLIGESAPLLQQALTEAAPVHRAESMVDAVALARSLAQPGDSVLLAPACASFDMFDHYEHRGEVFSAAVRQLAGMEVH